MYFIYFIYRLWSPLLEWIRTVDGLVVDASNVHFDWQWLWCHQFVRFLSCVRGWVQLTNGEEEQISHTHTNCLWSVPVSLSYQIYISLDQIDPLTGTTRHARQSCSGVFQLLERLELRGDSDTVVLLSSVAYMIPRKHHVLKKNLNKLIMVSPIAQCDTRRHVNT